jgi:MFS family permease
MPSVVASSAPRRLFATSILARLPLAMLSIGLLVHAQHLTGSFAAAGLVTGVYAIALGVGGPLLGALVDRRGQTSVLLVSAVVAMSLLVAIAVQPVHTSLPVLVALAAGIGLSEPPVGACLRTQLPALLRDPSQIRAAYALEASVVELTFIFGPPLVLCVGALSSTGAALAAGGVVLLLATAAFAAQPASRSRRPANTPRHLRRGSLGTPAMRTLMLVLIPVGVLLGADEVAVVAAARALNSTAAAAPLLAVWGAGSFAGGLLAARLGGGARTATGLGLVLGALTGGHLALVPAAGSVPVLGGVLLLAGATIAPTEAAIYAMVDHASPVETMTEAFAWLATAMAVGGALGAAGAGQLVDRAGPTAGFAFAGAAGAFAVLLTLLRSRTIAPASHPQERALPPRALVPNPTSPSHHTTVTAPSSSRALTPRRHHEHQLTRH